MVDRGTNGNTPDHPLSTQSSEACNASPWFWIFGVWAGCYNDQHLSHFLVCRLQSSGDWLKHRGLGWGTRYKGLVMACPYSADYTTLNSKNPNTNYANSDHKQRAGKNAVRNYKESGQWMPRAQSGPGIFRG